jgi:hypothetical protein
MIMMVCDQILDHFAKYEKHLHEKSEELERLKDQMAPLLKCASEPPPPEPAFSPRDVTLVQEGIKLRVAEEMQQHLLPLVVQLKENYSQELGKFKEDVHQEFWAKLQDPISEAISILRQAQRPSH